MASMVVDWGRRSVPFASLLQLLPTGLWKKLMFELVNVFRSLKGDLAIIVQDSHSKSTRMETARFQRNLNSASNSLTKWWLAGGS